MATVGQREMFEVDVCTPFHHNNPQSRAAFEELLPRLGALQEKVLAYTAVCTETAQIVTVKTVRADLGLEHQTASARITELKAMGLIEPSGLRKDGCAAMRITDLGRRTLKEWQKSH